MVFGGLVDILVAIWVYRTAVEQKTGNALYWAAGSFIVSLAVQLLMIYFNGFVIESFDTDINSEYDSAGGLNARDNSDTAGLQTGSGGTLIGIIFEILPLVAPVIAVAVLRQLVMLKQSFSFLTLFSGVKEMFVSIKNSFKTS